MKRNTLQAGLALALAGGMLALASAANAQDTEETKVLYKCVDAKGVVSIQAKKCPAGSTEAWRRDAQTEPKQTAAEAEAARQREARNQQEVRDLSVEVQRKLAGDPPPERSSPPEGSHQAGATNPPEGSHRAPIQPPEAPDPTSLNISGCQQAQSFSSAVREKSWLGLNEDQTRRLYAWVADQCRVNTAKDD